MKRAILICLIVCFLTPIAFAQGQADAKPAPCKAYFTVLETDEVTVGLPMLGLNKPQLSWYKKHGNEGKFTAICYWDLTAGSGSQLSLAEFVSKEKSGAIQEPDATFYVITWGESLITQPYVGSRRTETVTEDNSNNTSRTITVPVTETYAGTKRYYMAEGILQRWDQKTQSLIPVLPIHNHNRTVFTSASTSLLKSGLAAIKIAEERETTESARTFEYAIQLGTKAAKFFADVAAFDEKLVTVADTDTLKHTLKQRATVWRDQADDLSKTTSDTAKYVGGATADDLTRKHNIEQIEKWRDDTLTRGCPLLEDQRNINRSWDALRAKLPPDVIQALDAEEADEAALEADCSSELAIGLLKQHAQKPPAN